MSIIGKKYRVNIIHPIGSVYEENEDIKFEVNHGIVENEVDALGNPQEAYVLGIDKPLSYFDGRLIAIIHRTNDIENKWVISNIHYSKEEILEKVSFIEKYFNVEVII